MLAGWVQHALDRGNISQAKLARELTDALGRSIDRAAVNKMVSGRRQIAADEMVQIARITGHPAPTLDPVHEVTRIVGWVGAGAVWAPFDPGELGEIDRPAWANEKTVAAEIRGDSLGSMFDRWLVFYDDVHEMPTAKMLGRLCIVWLVDKRVMVKKILRGQVRGLFTLTSNFDPPIYDVAVERCALVNHMAPR